MGGWSGMGNKRVLGLSFTNPLNWALGGLVVRIWRIYTVEKARSQDGAVVVSAHPHIFLD